MVSPYRTALIALSLLALALAKLTSAQYAYTPSGAPAASDQLQAVARAAYSAKDFEYTFPPVPDTPQNQLGSVRGLFGDAAPALVTLPASGLGQTLVNLVGCGEYTPHHHPRANEILYVATGTASIGFHEENNGTLANGMMYGGRILNETVAAGSAYVIPQGLIHYISNPGCTNATLIGSFDNRDPGTVTIAQQFFELPYSVIAAATGLDNIAIGLVQQRLSAQSIVSLDPVCAAACNASNAQAPAASAASTQPPGTG